MDVESGLDVDDPLMDAPPLLLPAAEARDLFPVIVSWAQLNVGIWQ